MSWRAPARSEDRGRCVRSLRRAPSRGRWGVGRGAASARSEPGGRHRHGYTTPGVGGPLAGASEGLRPRRCGGTPADASAPLRSVPLRCPITGRTYAAHRPRWDRSPGLVRLAARLSAAPPCGPATWPHRSVRAEQGRSARMRRGPGGLRGGGGCRLGLVPRPPGPPPVNPLGAAPCETGARGTPPGCHPPGGSPRVVPRQGFALRACILTRFLPAVGLRLPVQPLTRFPLEQPQTALGAVFRGWVGVE